MASAIYGLTPAVKGRSEAIVVIRDERDKQYN